VRILITGGAGFIGEHLAEALTQAGHELVCLDLHEPRSGLYQASWRGDVRDEVSVREAMRGCTAVFHLAAAHHDSGIATQTYFDVNETGSGVIADVAAEYDVDTLVFTSSVAVYGEDAPCPDERYPPAPTSDYGASKLAGEVKLRAWQSRAPSRRLAFVRPAAVFGENNFANMYSLLRQIHRRRFISVGPGKNRKSIVYVGNLIPLLIKMLDAATTGSPYVVNAVDSPDLTSREISDTIAQTFGIWMPPVSIPLPVAMALALPFEGVSRMTGRNIAISRHRIRKFAMVDSRFSGERMNALLGQAPFDLRGALRRTAEWYMREGAHRPLVRRIPPPSVVRRAAHHTANT
jgi:nucleoside-diphosphate-sugar epimerase